MLKKLLVTGLIVCMFLVGWFASGAYSNVNIQEQPLADSNREKASPHDRLKESQILVYSDKVVIKQKDVSWASYTDTNSMDPLFDKGANGLELVPQSEDELYVGDIVAYRSNLVAGLIVHRIVDIREDVDGKYFVLKGDNNQDNDPERVRFNQIGYVLIGVLY